MRAFVAGCVAAVVLAVVAAVILNQLGLSSADVYSSASVNR